MSLEAWDEHGDGGRHGQAVNLDTWPSRTVPRSAACFGRSPFARPARSARLGPAGPAVPPSGYRQRPREHRPTVRPAPLASPARSVGSHGKSGAERAEADRVARPFRPGGMHRDIRRAASSCLAPHLGEPHFSPTNNRCSWTCRARQSGLPAGPRFPPPAKPDILRDGPGQSPGTIPPIDLRWEHADRGQAAPILAVATAPPGVSDG